MPINSVAVVMKFEWEQIFLVNDPRSTALNIVTYRAKVLDGWMVSNTVVLGGNLSTSMQFVSDADYKWEIDRYIPEEVPLDNQC